ncbi:hypothetical protein [Chroococcidiopsis sp [FACHB-1243]]|nr:hypothetical protein [Chroococcidiopsis sp. [FACHB-1243]]
MVSSLGSRERQGRQGRQGGQGGQVAPERLSNSKFPDSCTGGFT